MDTSGPVNVNPDADVFGIPPEFSPLRIDGDLPAFPSVEGYFLGSFMPGVADFESPSFGGARMGADPLSGFQNWDFNDNSGASVRGEGGGTGCKT